jgi:hypothetical protein
MLAVAGVHPGLVELLQRVLLPESHRDDLCCGCVRADPWLAPAFSLQVHFEPKDGVMPLGDLLDRQAGVHAVAEVQLTKDRANAERICSLWTACTHCPSPLSVLDKDGRWRTPASIREVFLTLPEVLVLEFILLHVGRQVEDYGRRPHIVELPERMDLAPAVAARCSAAGGKGPFHLRAAVHRHEVAPSSPVAGADCCAAAVTLLLCCCS